MKISTESEESGKVNYVCDDAIIAFPPDGLDKKTLADITAEDENQELGERAWGSKLKSSQLKARRLESSRDLETPASNTDFMSIDGEMEALGRDYPEVEVVPRSKEQEVGRRSKEQEAGRRSRQEVHTLYPPLLPQPDALNRSGNSLQRTPRVHNRRSQKPAGPPGPPGPPSLPNLAKLGLGISIQKVAPKPDPMLLPQIARISQNLNLNVSIAK